VNLGDGDDFSAENPIDPRPILIVTGLLQEARIAAGPGMAVICSSSDPRQLRALLTVFDPTTIRGVISFGVAGGLDPSLKSGDVVVATEVMAGDARWLAGLSLNETLLSGLALGRRRIVRGGLAGVEEVVMARARKAALRSVTGAAAVDMESAAIARVAQAHGLPFIAVRVIVDVASDALPDSVREAAGVTGKLKIGRLLARLCRRPQDVVPLTRLTRRYLEARRALAAIAHSGALAAQAPGLT
jgi:hopanoid-associated phosphorylase